MSYRKDKSFHIEHVADDYEVNNMRPVLHSSEDVKRMVERSQRARLISQIVGAPEDSFTRDFMSSFQSAARDSEPPQFSTSHKTRSEPRRKAVIPTYPSITQSLRWSPYVEMSSADNSRTNLVEDKPKFNCRCESCSMKNCPSRVSSSHNLKSGIFKDNIMTFSDRCTMTPKLNDACCGVRTPIPTTPRTSDVCVPPDVAVRDTETVTHLPMYYQQCNPIPILKRPEYDPSCTYGYCGHATGHVPAGIRQEAVRDTDMVDDYCEPIKPKSLKSFFRVKKKPVPDVSLFMPDYGRKIIYNEGISDKVATCPLPPNRVPSSMNVNRGTSSRVSFRSKTKCCVDDNTIPFSHRTESRYHYSCKEPAMSPIYHTTDDGYMKHLVESPKLVRKAYTSRPVRQFRHPTISLPKKMLTSEDNIDCYIDKGRKELSDDVGRARIKYKK